MSHIVIHDDSDSVTRYAEFDDVQSAAAYLEDLVNDDAGANARLFALDPVEFAVKSYVRVEIGGIADDPAPLVAKTSEPETVAGPPDAAVLAETPADDPVASDDVGDGTELDDTVEYVEAAMAPVDSFAPAPPMSDLVEADTGGEARRGLFGR